MKVAKNLKFTVKFPARSFLAVALGALTLGAAHPPAEQNAKRAAMERMRTFFRADTDKRVPVPSAIRRIQLMYELSTSAVREAEFKRSRPAIVTSASAAYKVKNLNASVPGFFPAALNNDGRMVGDSLAPDDYNAYLINNSGSSGTLFDQYVEGCEGPGFDVFCYTNPTAITNKSGLAGGIYYSTDQGNNLERVGWIVWKLAATTSTISYVTDNLNGPNVTILGMSDQNIAVGDTSYFPLFGSSYGDDIQFPIFKCTLSNFDAMSINDSGLIAGASNGRAATMMLGGCPAYVPNVGPGVSIADVVADDGDMLIQTAQTSFVWSKGRISDIPLPTGYDSPTYQIDALSLNNSGKVVGEIFQRSSKRSVAGFEYSSGHSVDIESLFPPHSGWTVLAATAINDHDEIAGIGILATQYGGFALTH